MRRRALLALGSGIVAGGAALAGIMIVRDLSGPAVGTVASTKTPVARAQKVVHHRGIDGKYARYEVLDTYRLEKTQGTVATPGEDRQVLVSASSPVRIISVSVRPSAGTDRESDFKARKLSPKVYRESVRTIEGARVVQMSKVEGGYEEVVFWPRAGKVAVIAMSTSSGSREEFDAEFAQLIASWRWK